MLASIMGSATAQIAITARRARKKGSVDQERMPLWRATRGALAHT